MSSQFFNNLEKSLLIFSSNIFKVFSISLFMCPLFSQAMEQSFNLYQVTQQNLSENDKVKVQLLKDVYTDLTIASFLGFRGGSAATLFYGLSRPLVDLDFDLLEETKKDFVFERVQKILERYGTVTTQQDDLDCGYLLSYSDKKHNTYNISIDINLRKFKSQYKTKPYHDIAIKVMTQDDMAAHKLATMYTRFGEVNHDIFDTWFMLKNSWPINVEMIEKKTGLPIKEFLQKCIDKLENIGTCEVASDLDELLDEKQKI